MHLPVLALSMSLALVACGAEGDDPDHADKPVPGWADPCDTPMAGVLGCPATPGSSRSAARPEDACVYLVSCGILADKHEVKSGDEWRHYLDYRWCTERLRTPIERRCSVGGHYSMQEVSATISCILATPCGVLGAPLSEKDQGTSRRPDFDAFFCADGKTEIWTATICDHGLLAY
ncbi:MAG: hypothetical protein CSB49_06630 [Proteobacteria bacterium]|nr:MAG: hypothetical protein CSB49_06630 [Pseudomonadota bacterium]